MSRMVNADALQNQIEDEFNYFYGTPNERRLQEQKKNFAISFLREADSVELVRCRECRHNYNPVTNNGVMIPRCGYTDRSLTADDFCSKGELRE